MMLPKDKNGVLLKNEKYFDPDIWIMDGMYYGLNARSSGEPPVIMKSNNLKDWTHIGELLHPDFDEKKLGVRRQEDISCPNFFKLGHPSTGLGAGKWVLVCISHGLGCRYFIGDFVNEQFLPESHAILGERGNQYFAPETLLTPDNRRVLWSWYRGASIKSIQSLPTELALGADGEMRIRPIRELEALRYGQKQEQDVLVKKGAPTILDNISGDRLELMLEIQDSGEYSFGLDVLCNDEGKDGLRITINRENGRLEVGSHHLPYTLESNEPLTLRIFIDGMLVEVFANETQMVMGDQKREAEEPINDAVTIFTDGDELKVDKFTAWQMKSIYN